MYFNDAPNVVVNALAGTGKTTTIAEAVHALSGNSRRPFKPSEEQREIIETIQLQKYVGRMHMTSFSTDATEQLQEKVPACVEASSTYGMGLAAAKRLGMAGRVDRGDWKYGAILTEFMKGIRDDERHKGMRMDLLSLCGKARLNLSMQLNEEQLEDLAAHYGIDIPWNGKQLFLDAINHLLLEGRRQENYFDYVDMVYIPCVLGILSPKYDQLFVDEYQDMGKAQQEVCCRVGRRIIAIGDPNQAIYGFIGADCNATESFRRRLTDRFGGVKVLPLSYTRRCGHEIVAEANKIVPALKALPEAPQGIVKNTSCDAFNPMGLNPGDMLICPTNAPLVSLMFRLNKAGIVAFIRKSDIVDRMIDYVQGYEEKGFDKLVGGIEKMLESVQGKNTRKARQIRDRYQAMKEICEQEYTISGVIRSIAMMFDNKDRPNAVKLSTVHRAKGQEADRVVFWEWDRCGAYAELPWEKVEANNLKYVGVTRAKHELIMCRS